MEGVGATTDTERSTTTTPTIPWRKAGEVFEPDFATGPVGVTTTKGGVGPDPYEVPIVIVVELLDGVDELEVTEASSPSRFSGDVVFTNIVVFREPTITTTPAEVPV